MLNKRCGIAVLILIAACAPSMEVWDGEVETAGKPWVVGDTLHIYLCCANGLQKGEYWHGYLLNAPEPFLWGVAYTAQYVFNFHLMNGIPFTPAPPCTLEFFETFGYPAR